MNAEEELQKRIQENVLEGLDKQDLETIAYSSVFRALPKVKEYSAPANLADAVIKKLEERSDKKRLFVQNDLVWLITGIFLLLIACVYTSIQLKFKIDFGFLNGFIHKGLVVFGVCFIAILNHIDRRLVKRKRTFIA